VGGKRGGLHLERQRCADGHGYAACHDSIRAHDSEIEVGHVQRPALAGAVADFARGQFGHHVAHIAALGDQVTVAAVGAGDEVILVERGARADCARLLADVRVNEAGNQPLAAFVNRAQFKLADEHQLLVKFQQSIIPK